MKGVVCPLSEFPPNYLLIYVKRYISNLQGIVHVVPSGRGASVLYGDLVLRRTSHRLIPKIDRRNVNPSILDELSMLDRMGRLYNNIITCRRVEKNGGKIFYYKNLYRYFYMN